MASYTFKGQVKVADVQAAFDDFINRINKMVDTYNATEIVLKNTDLTVGSPTLASTDYTLSVGGIKQLLEAYDGVLIGCRAIRVDSNHVAVTDGIYFTKEKPVRVKAQVLQGNSFDIYYSPDKNEVGLISDDEIPEGAFIISNLSNTSTDTYLSTIRDVQLEGLDGYKIVINKRGMPWGVEGDNTSSHRFQGSCVFQVNSAGADSITWASTGWALAQGYAFNGSGVKRAHSSFGPANFLFIPKGQQSPIVVHGNNHTSRTNYSFKLEKPTS